MSEIREIRDGKTDVRVREMNTYFFFFFFSVSDSFLQEGRKGLYECGAWCVLFVFGIGGERRETL